MTRGYFDDKGKLAWITESGSADRRRLTWEGERLVSSELLSGDSVESVTILKYGSHGELLNLTLLRDPSNEKREAEWWNGTYTGTFGAVSRPGPLRTFRLLDQDLSWPPHMPFVEGHAVPSFRGKLDVTYGWPQSYELHCDVTEGAGRCVDDYERVTVLRGLQIGRMENPKGHGGKEDATRDYVYEGDRLTKIVMRDDKGAATYVSTFSYDAKGRPVKVHNTDFGSTDITQRLEYRCDDVR
ncbi:MAG: hypothetical protein HOV80_11525 [Polyangiaceae bacterium]|nr:hypothetical protein [Polyangiaceae bacterium]